MAVLTDAERAEIWAEYMRARLCPGSVLKTELRAAVDAVDTWFDANVASLNAALPEPFKSAASAELKAELLSRIAKKHAAGV